MKHIYTVILLLIFSTSAFSQAFLDEIAEKACTCLKETPDTLSSDEFNMQLGLCILEVSMPYEKQLRRQLNIDLSRIDEQGEQLGRMVGLRMATKCPEALQRMMATVSDESDEVIVADNSVEGIITRVDSNCFIKFTLKDNNGREIKLYWFTRIESDLDMINDYARLLDHSVLVQYDVEEMYDPMIRDYRNFNVIKAIQVFD